jgi:hypothetical protein
MLWYPEPHLAERLMVPPSKMRVFVVPLCQSCASLPDVGDLVERGIIREAELLAGSASLN